MTHLSAQGMQANQQIFFLSDGADNLRDLQFGMYPESTHVLDWLALLQIVGGDKLIIPFC